jgi:hypothetical protein
MGRHISCLRRLLPRLRVFAPYANWPKWMSQAPSWWFGSRRLSRLEVTRNLSTVVFYTFKALGLITRTRMTSTVLWQDFSSEQIHRLSHFPMD